MKNNLSHQTRTPRILVVLSLIMAIMPGHTDADDFSDELPRIPVVTAQESLKTFEVADGFRIELVASEPQINSPVAIEWNAAGNLFVCEMRGYSEDRDDALSRISLLTDRDDDGFYESSTVYASGLLWPTALFPFDGGLFVADAPNIYYFRDTDGDGKADEKKLVLTGFGVSNVQGLLNSFRWGLDNRIHLACGTIGGNVRRADDPKSSAVNVRGHDLAFDPRSGEFELTSGGAQHGMSFDDWGRKYVSSNSDHLQQVMYEDRYVGRNRFFPAPPARASIAADGRQAEVYRISPVEPWRIVRTRLRVAGLVRGPVEGGGRAAGYFTGATGVTIFRGDGWPGAFRGLAFVGDVGSNLVHRKRLDPRGVQRVGRRIDQQTEFIASRNVWFRPAQFACGPDGTLSIVDVCREVIEHPASLPPDIKRHLDLTSGRDRGRIYRVVPNNYKPREMFDLTSMLTVELVDLLDHPNAWHRETAARLIFERQDSTAVDRLRLFARRLPTPQGRMHCLYALLGLGELDEETILKALADDHPEVVRHAIRLSELMAISGPLIAALKPLVAHESADVRYQLAFSLGEWEFDQKTDWLVKLLDGNDRWMQTAVASSIGNNAVPLFVSVLKSSFADAQSIESNASWEIGSYLGKLANQITRQSDRQSRTQSLDGILKSNDHPALLPVLSTLAGADSELLTADKEKSVRSKSASLTRMAIATANNADAEESTRERAIEALRFGKEDAVLQGIDRLLSGSESSSIQSAAIKTLGRYRSTRTSSRLTQNWRAWSPRLRGAALDVLLTNPAGKRAVAKAIDDGLIRENEIPISRWRTLAADKIPEIRRRANAYLESTTSRSRESVITQYKSALDSKGNFDRGRRVFAKQCAGCHRIGDLGHELGPSLAAAITRGSESILVNVLDPNREVNPQYLNYVVLTHDGSTYTGMIGSENATAITLRRAESVSQTVLRSEIETIRGTGQSIMPEGLEKNMTAQDMADLLEFLNR